MIDSGTDAVDKADAGDQNGPNDRMNSADGKGPNDREHMVERTDATNGADPAGDGTVGRRIAAFLIDTVVVGAVCHAVSSRRTSTRRRRVALTATLAAVLGFVYHAVLEGRTGQTIGKRLCGIEVVSVDGGPCSYRAATIRTAGRFVDALPIGYVVGLVAIRLTERNQRLGDLLAGTVVVRTGVETTERAPDGGE